MKGYRLVDWFTQGYLLLVGCLIVLFHNATVPHWGMLVALHALGLSVVHGLVSAGDDASAPKPLQLLRDFYPLLFFVASLRETAALNRLLTPDYLDPFFIRLEDQWFGGQPSLVAMERWPSVLLSELLHAAYLSYYLMVAGVGLLLWRKGRGPFRQFVTVTTFTFYVCYLVFITLPVVGPPIFGTDLLAEEMVRGLFHGQLPSPIPAAIQAGPLFRLTGLLYAGFERPGGAFPSSHVALALVTACFSWRHLPRLRWLHLALLPLLCAATVYGRYHYLVDVFAGAAAGALLLPLGNWLHRRFDRDVDGHSARS